MRRSIILFLVALVIAQVAGNCFQACKTSGTPYVNCFKRCRAELLAKNVVVQSDQQDVPVTSKFIWESYVAELFNFMKRGSSTTGLQILRTPIEATWNVNNETLAEFANKQVQWGVEYKTNGKKLPEEYIKFLKNIKVSSASGADAKRIQQEIEENKKQIADLNTRIEDYNKRCAMRPGSFACDAALRMQDTMAIFESNIARLEQEIPFGDLKKAVKEFEEAQAENNFEWREKFGKLATFVQRVEDKRADNFRILVSRNSLYNKKESQDWSWEQVAKEGQQLIATTGENGKVQYHQHSFTTNSNYFKMDIEAQGYTVIEVTPGAWFDSQVVQKYAKGPFVSTIGANYFNKGAGSLSLLLKKLYLVYKPSVSLYLAKDDAEYLRNLCKTAKTITVGPFSADAKSVTVGDKPIDGVRLLYKVTLQSQVETPIIVATENQIMP